MTNIQLKLFEDPTPHVYVKRAQFSELEKELNKAISNRDSEKVYELSNELGITHNENDPILELYQEGQKWIEQKEEKTIVHEWDNLQYLRKQTKKALDLSNSYNNGQINDISSFVELHHPRFNTKKESIQDYDDNEIFGMFKQLQKGYDAQHSRLEKTSKKFFQRNEDVLKKYIN